MNNQNPEPLAETPKSEATEKYIERGHWSQPCGYCGALAGSPCMNHAGTKHIKHVHLKRIAPRSSTEIRSEVEKEDA
jgi:hypothetical protein